MAAIGVQMMMLKNKVEEFGPYEVLRRLHGVGFTAVEVSQIPMTTENVAEMRRAKNKLGIDFAALSAGLRLRQDPRRRPGVGGVPAADRDDAVRRDGLPGGPAGVLPTGRGDRHPARR